MASSSWSRPSLATVAAMSWDVYWVRQEQPKHLTMSLEPSTFAIRAGLSLGALAGAHSRIDWQVWDGN
jgi:hypothetical protein